MCQEAESEFSLDSSFLLAPGKVPVQAFLFSKVAVIFWLSF